jgi:Ca2+-binding EF-hand superfamily protein
VAGFETMLSLMNITTNETTVRQLLAAFIAKPSFQQFIDVFERVVESSLRESVVDYFEIVLDGKWSRELGFEELTQLLSERMSSYHAKEIVEEVYFELERDSAHKVNVQDIVGLCYRSEEFCAFMRGYCQETQRKRLSQKPRGKLPF